MKILRSPWIVSLVGTLLYLGATVALINPSKLQGARPNISDKKSPAVPSWDFRNPEFEQMVEDLRQQKEDLRQREQRLKDWENRLESERAEIYSVTQAVARLQRQFDGNVIRLKDEETANLRKLAKLHATMSPDASANILRELGDDEGAKILVYMKAEEAAAVLEAFGKMGKDEAKRAAVLSDRMRRTISPAAPDKGGAR